MKFDSKPAYSVAELAVIFHLAPQQVRRLLTRGSVRVIGGGKRGAKMLVPLSSFREAFPDLWDSLRLLGGCNAENNEER